MPRLSFRRFCLFLFITALIIFILALQPPLSTTQYGSPSQGGELIEVINSKKLLSEEAKFIKSTMLLREEILVPPVKNFLAKGKERSIFEPTPILEGDKEDVRREKIQNEEDREVVNIAANLQIQPLIDESWFKPREIITPGNLNSIKPSRGATDDESNKNELDDGMKRIRVKKVISSGPVTFTLPILDRNGRNEEIEQKENDTAMDLYGKKHQKPIAAMLHTEQVMSKKFLPRKKNKKHKKKQRGELNRENNQSLKKGDLKLISYKFMSRRAMQTNMPSIKFTDMEHIKGSEREKLIGNPGFKAREPFSIKKIKRKKTGQKENRRSLFVKKNVILEERRKGKHVRERLNKEKDEPLELNLLDGPRAIIVTSRSDGTNSLIRRKVRPIHEVMSASEESIIVKGPYERNPSYQRNLPFPPDRLLWKGNERTEKKINEGDRETMNLSVMLQIQPVIDEPWFRPEVIVKPMNVKAIKLSAEANDDKGTVALVKRIFGRPRFTSKSTIMLKKSPLAANNERQEVGEAKEEEIEEVMSLSENQGERTIGEIPRERVTPINLLSAENYGRNEHIGKGKLIREKLKISDNAVEKISSKPRFIPRKAKKGKRHATHSHFMKHPDSKRLSVNGRKKLIGDRGPMLGKSFPVKKKRKTSKRRNKRHKKDTRKREFI